MLTRWKAALVQGHFAVITSETYATPADETVDYIGAKGSISARAFCTLVYLHFTINAGKTGFTKTGVAIGSIDATASVLTRRRCTVIYMCTDVALTEYIHFTEEQYKLNMLWGKCVRSY